MDSLSGLDERALQELDGEVRSAAAAGGCSEMGIGWRVTVIPSPRSEAPNGGALAVRGPGRTSDA
jgi:hypothetical protein